MDSPKELMRTGFYQGMGQSAWWLLASGVGFAVGYFLFPKPINKPCPGSGGCKCGGNCKCGGGK